MKTHIRSPSGSDVIDAEPPSDEAKLPPTDFLKAKYKDNNILHLFINTCQYKFPTGFILKT